MMQPQGSVLLLTVLAVLLQPSGEDQPDRPQTVQSPAAAGEPGPGRPVEEVVVERAARQYRMQLYHTFRRQRDEYDRRRAVWERVVAAWQAAGSRADQRHLLLAWLQEAIRRSTPGTLGPLPEIPNFGPEGPAAVTPATPPPTPEPAPPIPTSIPPIPTSIPPIPTSAPTVAEPQPALEPSSTFDVQPNPPPWTFVRPRLPGPGEDRPPVQLPRRALGPRQTAIAKSTAALEKPRLEPRASDTPIPLALPSLLATLPGVAPEDHPATAGPRGRGETSDGPANTASRVAAVPPAPPAHHMPDGEMPPLVTQPTSPAPKSPRAVINQTELAARILGGNLALRECEAELDKDRVWNAEALIPIVARLRRLMIQRHDCGLLYDLLPESDRALVGKFDSLRPVIRALSKRIAEARTRAQSTGFPGTDAQRAAELRVLDELAQTVAELAAN